MTMQTGTWVLGKDPPGKNPPGPKRNHDPDPNPDPFKGEGYRVVFY